LASSPAKAKFIGRKVKFALLDTKTAILKEAAPRDYHWGIGKTGNGKNRLGVLLMKVREELGKS